MYRSPVLIYNPTAGKLKRNNQRLVEEVATALRESAGIPARLIPTTGPNTAGKLAADAIGGGADLVIGLGGDGTINEIASGVVGSDVPLAILPGGTANVMSIEIRSGTHAVRAARKLNQRVPLRIAVGKLELDGQAPRYFLAMTGVGLDAHVVHKVNPLLKKATGKLAYWVAGLQHFFSTMEPVPIDGISYGFVLASRVRNYGGDLELARGASLLKDEFEIVKFKGTNPLFYAAYMSGAMIRAHAKLPGVTTHKASRIDFPEPGAHVQVDGEYVGMTPASVEIVPDSLTLLVPPDFKG